MRRELVIALAFAACRGEPVAPSSTIRANDYIGPAACGDCHAEQYAAWRASLHAVMNQRAEPGALIGDFATTIQYGGGEVAFASTAGGPTMTLVRDGRTVRYRVTRTIGHRGLQEYVGIDDGGPGDEVRLPFGWWPRGGGWFPQPYFDPWLDEDDVDPFAPVREPWAERCPWCHSTYPFEQRVARASRPHPLGHGLERHYRSAPGVAQSGEDAGLREAMTRGRLDLDRQVTVGISCESCHLGGREHAAGAPIHFVPLGAEPRPGAPAPTAFAIERRDPQIVGAVCAQCHSGPSPRLRDGTALRNSSESLDLEASPCTAIRCTDCHDPHRGGSDEERAVAACTRCHARTAPHAGAGHGQLSCLDCHMPRLVMGIDRFVRTHRIATPGNPELLASGAPNACNLCHLDRSIAWTAAELQRRGAHLEPAAWSTTPAGEAWLASPRPAFRILAAAAYARSPLGRAALPALRRGLGDELAYVRMWTRFAIDELRGP